MLTDAFEAVLPVDVALHSYHLSTFQEALNNVALQEVLDLLPSIWGDALLREMIYKLHVARLHDHTVKFHPINMDDLILSRTKAVVRSGEHGKLTAN